MTVFYRDDQIELHHGDCLDIMAALPDESIDAVVTDPPYGLAFMGRSWDQAGIVFNIDTWKHCLRLLKPGGHLLAFGGTRTSHRLACAIEDAGFEIRDSIAWLYGSGFPKSLDVSKAIDKAAGAEREVVGRYKSPEGTTGINSRDDDYGFGLGDMSQRLLIAPATDAAKQWAGWGTALKPSFELVVVARKPIQGTVANNVMAHGTGAINIDTCRVAHNEPPGKPQRGMAGREKGQLGGGGTASYRERETDAASPAGRWPTNVVIDDTAAAEIDEQSGNRLGFSTQRHLSPKKPCMFGHGDGADTKPFHDGYDDTGGASRFFPTFRYHPKAPTTERPTAEGIAHPTVKPLDLMRWLVRLVTPPHGLVLDPFAGSGTTAEACIHEHKRCIAIEREQDYLPLITARLCKPMAVGFDFEEGA
jgi:DNA modification methylase